MVIKERSSYKYHTKTLLDKMRGVNKRQYNFIIEIFGLFLSIKGRMNFLQLDRYGRYGEQCYRGRFGKPFDFLGFNCGLVHEHCGNHLTLAFDPSYVGKSGKTTPGLGYFWSGVAGKTKWGLEISGIAAVDIDNRTAFHLEAVQVPGDLGRDSLLVHYAKVLVKRKKALLSISRYVVADAYFSKNGFVTKLTGNGFEVVGRLRDDADLLYKYKGAQRKGRGRSKKYDGKIRYGDLDGEHLATIEENDRNRIYHGTVYSKSLKRDINLVLAQTLKKGKWKHKLYFSTDLTLSPQTLLNYYRTRFQIEFVFRDAKQHTGLEHCQARSLEKLHFHFNAALTTVNLAKTAYWLSLPKEKRGAFSMADIKTLCHNELLLKRFLSVFGISPYLTKNKEKMGELLYYGTRAA